MRLSQKALMTATNLEWVALLVSTSPAKIL